MTLVFENRDTVLFQVQEVLRIERIVRPQKVQEELDAYSELLPDDRRALPPDRAARTESPRCTTSDFRWGRTAARP
ncbi:MAG: DUF3501 family protein [Acidobacteriota bacterium]